MGMGCVARAAGLVCALGLSACLGNSVTNTGEVTEYGGLRVQESRMHAEVSGSTIAFSLTIERSERRSFGGGIRVQLKDMEGKVLGSQERVFRLENDEAEYRLVLSGIPPVTGLEELSKYLIGYRVEWDGNALYGSRSVYSAVRKLETQVFSAARFYEGERGFMRVLARDPGTAEAIAGMDVAVELQLADSSTALGHGTTDSTGTAEVFLEIPRGLLGTGQMLVTMRTQEGDQEQVSSGIELLREEKILLSSDKPIYQPGQVIHMRLLALRRPELKPVGSEEALFEVRDGKGNKVFKHLSQTSEFGVAAADFKLATEVNLGDFEIRAQVGTTESKKTVEVKRYALPKFGLSFKPDRGYYLPSERVTGTVEARYFFGKPVSGGTVRVTLSTFDVGLVEIGEVVGQLGPDGVYGFQTDLPNSFVGIDLLQGDAYLQFDVEVTDLAGHTETATVVSVVAASPLQVTLVPESGDLVPGLPNVLYVVTADPTGMPVPATVELAGEAMAPLTLTTDEHGLGQATVTPAGDSLVLEVTAQDALGNQVERQVALQSGKSGSVVLLRVDRRLYQVGDTVHLTVLATDPRDRVYLDLIKGNQTLLAHALDLREGRADYELELTPEMEGNVQFDAYYLTRESQIVRDTQLILVQGARSLQVDVSLDKEQYLPAETSRVTFEVKDDSGQGVAAALGLSIVDEAVFALTEFRPGLAETFFEIEQEILKPRFEIHSSALSGYLDESWSREQRESSAAVAFAAAQGFAGYGFQKNSYVDAVKKMGSLLKERLNQDATAIVDTLRIFGAQGLITAENLASWVKRHGQDWTDPFGQPYRVEVKGTNEWDQILIFHSAGPDEIAGSPDDVASDQYFTWYIFYGRGGDCWGCQFDADMAGGGEGPPHVDPGEGCLGGDCNPGGGDESQGSAPRVRAFFPETLYFNPALLTDANGQATVEIPLADSITTWRMTTLASSLEGRIGSRADGIRVFQDFFIDVDFPATLTQGDQISVPVAVYNYLQEPQTVGLEVQPEAWFTLQDAGSKTTQLAAGEVGVVTFDLIAVDVGWHGLTVVGTGSKDADAVRRTVEVLPDGKEFRVSLSDRLAEQTRRTLVIPADAIDGASRIFVKIYPGLMSQAVEGLDALLQIPNGCFEQTTTTAWPNIMVLDYLQKSGQLTPAIELKARDYVNQSYQRILTFECPSGGFNWWVGDDPGNTILSAMALMMFADARQAVDIDLDVVRRTGEYVAGQQLPDGSWSGEDHLHAGNEVLGESALRASAFCTWGLAMSGGQDAAVDRGISYLHTALGGTDDMYTLALVACALAFHDEDDPQLTTLLADLEREKQTGDNGVIYWQSQKATASGAYGSNADIEVTALITQALIRAGMYPGLVNGAITWLIQQKDSFGTWNTTQATVQSLRAMTMAMDFAASQDAYGTAQVGINGVDSACSFEINPANSDVTRICELNTYTLEGDNQVSISLAGAGTFLYQVVGVYYLPWEMVSDSPDGPLSIDVTYDRTNLSVDDTVTVNVTVSYNIPGDSVSMIMLDLGIPPGFDVLTEDLQALTESEPRITRFELRGRQLSIYVNELTNGLPLTFQYRMKARFPINGQVPESAAWAYYNPGMRSVVKPVTFRVNP